MRFRRWVEVLWLFDRLPWYSWPESEPLAKRRSPHFVEHAGLTLQKQVRTTLCPTHLVVHDNSLASLLPRLLGDIAPAAPNHDHSMFRIIDSQV